MSQSSLSHLFQQAYEDYSDAIFRYCLVRIQQRELALDLTQETFIKTWEYLSDGKKVDNLRAFLYRVANNLIIDYVRKKKESSLDKLMEQGFDAPAEDRNTIHNALDAKYVIRMLGQIDEKYRTVILLRYVDDLPIKEIAEIVGKSENVVSVRIHRGVQQIKKLIPLQ